MGRWTVGLLPGMRCTWRWEPCWRPPVWDGWSAKAGSVGRPNGQGKESSLRRFEGAVRGTRLPVKASACAWTWQRPGASWLPSWMRRIPVTVRSSLCCGTSAEDPVPRDGRFRWRNEAGGICPHDNYYGRMSRDSSSPGLAQWNSCCIPFPHVPCSCPFGGSAKSRM